MKDTTEMFIKNLVLMGVIVLVGVEFCVNFLTLDFI